MADEIIKQERSITFSTKGTHLIQLKKENPIAVESAINQLIYDFVKQSNEPRSLNEDQIYRISMDIVNDYPYESLEDFALMFKMARSGRFSEAYGTIDQSQIYKWIGEYLELKAIDRENNFKNKPIDLPDGPAEYSPELAKLKESVSLDKKVSKPNRITFEQHYSMIKELIITYDKGDKNKLIRLKKDMQNNDSAYEKNYNELIKMIDEKLEL